MNYKEGLADKIHSRLLALRSMEHLVSQRDFQTLLLNVSIEHQERAKYLVDTFDHHGLREWYKQRRREQLGMLSVRELRAEASKIGIINYNKLSKPLLLSEIARFRFNADEAINSCAARRHEETYVASRSIGGAIPTAVGSC